MNYLSEVEEFVTAYYNGSMNGILSIYIKGYNACFRLMPAKMLFLSTQDENSIGLNFWYKRNTRKNKKTIDNIKNSGVFNSLGLIPNDSNEYSIIIKKEAGLVAQEVKTIIKSIYPDISDDNIEIIWDKNNEFFRIE